MERRRATPSLRNTLLLFALVLVSAPGLLFALLAFPVTRDALKREVGIQLYQVAEMGAEALATALQRAQGDAKSWARQDVMRDLVVGDVDKRVSRFLQTVCKEKPAYLEALCVDPAGTVIAAASGEWIGRDVAATLGGRRGDGSDMPVGPVTLAPGGQAALVFRVPIDNPDQPTAQIGDLILIYDWEGVRELLDGIRLKLAALGKHVAAMVVDRDGVVLGGVSFDGLPARRTALAAAQWSDAGRDGWGERTDGAAGAEAPRVLFGRADVGGVSLGWSVVVLEDEAEALAAVRRLRSGWIVIVGALLLGGLAVATLLARQIMRPLSEVTRATGRIAAHPDLALPLLPVRSRNEVGQLTDSFNRMTTALRQSQEQALTAAKFAFAGELAAMVAHEVRTPLSVMRSSAQMLGDPTAGGAHGKELVDTIVAEVDRVERVVSGLLQLARPMEQRLAPTRLEDVLSRAADFASAEARRRHVQLTCDGGNGSARALCDAEQIYQVTLNLVVNALQVLEPGGHVWLRTLPANAATVGFEVSDDGPGLPQTIRDHIFEPFVTAREGGTGLGLAFVERAVKLNHGSVSVRSESGRGTTFEVRLPPAELP